MNTKQIRQTILDLAIRGELVSQDPTDEPASVLLEHIRTEKEQLIKDKKLKRDKKDNEPIDEVPFELPEGWEWCRLGDCGNISRGGSPRPIKDFLTTAENGVNWIKISDTEQGGKYIYNTKEKIKPEGVKYSRFVEENDFLLTNSMSFGRPYILKTKGCIHDGWLVFKLNQRILDIDFIYYLLSSNFMFKQFSTLAVGSTVQNLKSESVQNSVIPLPPLAEQHRIAKKVEQLLTIVDTIEQLQEQLKSDVKQARNQVLNYAIVGKLTHQDPNDEPAEALLKRIGKTTTTAADTSYEKLPKGWAWCKLGDIANISMGQSPKGETVTRNSNGIEFHQGKIYFTDKYINKSPFFTSEPTKTTSNSVLLCVRAPVGEVNLVNREVCIGRGLCAIEPLGNISIDFCFFWLILLKDYFNENSTGSTFSSISGEIIRNAFIPLPPLAEQHRIVQQIETFFASFDQIEKMLT